MEELREIAQVIESLGDKGQIAFIVWVAVKSFVDLCGTVIITGAIVMIAKGIVGAVREYNKGETDRLSKKQ